MSGEDDCGPAARMEDLGLFSENRTTIDVWGSAFYDDMIGTVSGFYLKEPSIDARFYRGTSLVSQFTERAGPEASADEIDAPESARSEILRDYNRTLVQELQDSGSEWLIIDGFVAAVPMARVEYSNGDSEYISAADGKRVAAVDAMLTSKGIAHTVETVGLDYPGRILKKSVARAAEFLRQRYGDRIVLIEMEAPRLYIGERGEILPTGEDYGALNDALARFEDDFAEASGCRRIRRPGFMLSDHYHSGGPAPIGYAEEHYWYAFRCLCAIVGGEGEDRLEALKDSCTRSIASILNGTGTSAGNRLAMCRELVRARLPGEAAEILEEMKDRGEPRAMMMLGSMMVRGSGADQDVETGVSLMLKAYRKGVGAAADDLFDAVWKTGPYETAVRMVRDSAGKGRVSSMKRMSRACQEGKGVPRSLPTAVEWMKRAFDAEDDPRTACELFDLAWRLGKKESDETAVEAVRRYSDSDGECMLRLGMAYRDGRGVEKDIAEAAALFGSSGTAQGACELFDLLWGKGAEEQELIVETIRPFAEQGSAKAMWRLGRAYRYGSGVEKDPETSMEWMRKALDKGAAAAGADMVDMLWSVGTPEALEEAGKIAMEFAEKGEKWAPRRLGTMYWQGKGVEKDLSKAAEWMRKAVEGGNSKARPELFAILKETGTPESVEEMASLADKYAQKGEAWALARLGDCCRRGIGVEKDLHKAAGLLAEASRKGDAASACDLFDMAGNMKDQDLLKEAAGLLKPFAEKGNARCMDRLGRAYIRGNGVEADREKGLEWLRRASEADRAYSEEYRRTLDGQRGGSSSP